MRYFAAMQGKYGFGDGSAAPAGIEHYRRVYLLVLNALAAALGSTVRWVAYDRPGLHNWCMVHLTRADSTTSYTPEQLAAGDVPVPAAADLDPDDAMERAEQLAERLYLDEFIETKVRVRESDLKRFVGSKDILKHRVVRRELSVLDEINARDQRSQRD